MGFKPCLLSFLKYVSSTIIFSTWLSLGCFFFFLSPIILFIRCTKQVEVLEIFSLYLWSNCLTGKGLEARFCFLDSCDDTYICCWESLPVSDCVTQLPLHSSLQPKYFCRIGTCLENTGKYRVCDRTKSLRTLAGCVVTEVDYFIVASKSILTELKLLEKDQFQESMTIDLLLAHTSFHLSQGVLKKEICDILIWGVLTILMSFCKDHLY